MQIAGGGFHNVLVIGADALSRYVDWTDRGTCILFGDAAGAILVQVVFFSVKIFIIFSRNIFWEIFCVLIINICWNLLF